MDVIDPALIGHDAGSLVVCRDQRIRPRRWRTKILHTGFEDQWMGEIVI
jgi:hypothetical protein